jgi:hypothetical protein
MEGWRYGVVKNSILAEMVSISQLVAPLLLLVRKEGQGEGEGTDLRTSFGWPYSEKMRALACV